MEKLNQIIHEPVRLKAMSLLFLKETMTFGEIKNALKVTDGNLSRHLLKLEEAGYITIHKTFEGRRPKTYYRITVTGKKSYAQYIKSLEDIIKNAGS